MNTPNHVEEPVRPETSQDRMADTPHSVGAPFHGFQSLRGMKQSSRYGILLYLLFSPDHELSNDQILWIVYRQRKLSEAELLKAGKLALSLIENEVHRQRLKKEIRETHIRVPRITPSQIPEKRRIGIGYRDKGALRPLHQKFRDNSVSSYWDEDIMHLLPLDYETVGRWITADEVYSLVGVDLLSLSLASIQQNLISSSAVQPNLKIFRSGRRN